MEASAPSQAASIPIFDVRSTIAARSNDAEFCIEIAFTAYRGFVGQNDVASKIDPSLRRS
jgi:hypothetical protein